MSTNRSGKFRVLSLDGGGVRGVITAKWLARLEERLGGQVRDHFDLVAGTSTGSILACAVAAGIPAQDIVKMYVDRSQNIFPKLSKWNVLGKAWNAASSIAKDGISYPKYKPDGLKTEMKRVFKASTKLRQLKLKTMVTSYNTLSRQATIFKSWAEADLDHKVWEVCTASSSAPTYFPAHVMTIGGAKVPLVDGGVVANNPTACAIAEAVRLQIKKDIHAADVLSNLIVVSMGTGELTRPITIDESQEWGALEWAIPIIDVLFDGAADAASYIARQLVGEDHYHRLQCRLSEAYDDMDNADTTNINALRVVAEAYLSSTGGAKIEAIVEQLKGKTLTPAPRKKGAKTRRKRKVASVAG